MATIAEAAKHLDCDERTFKGYLDAGIVVRQSRGSYDLDEVREQYFRYMRGIGRERSSEVNTKRLDAGTRKDAAIAQRYELENEVLRAELLPRDEVKAGMDASFARVRSKLLAVAPAIAPTVAQLKTVTEIQEAIQQSIFTALADLAGTLVASPPQEGSGRRDEA